MNNNKKKQTFCNISNLTGSQALIESGTFFEQWQDGLFLKLTAWPTLLCFLGQTAGAGAGTIVADPSAPANQRPTILNTANGVPQVNIQTPSAAGVSRNTYRQFDVTSQGAILNNSRTSVQTQFGGWVQGNPALAGGTARVILNEVNSSNPSLLNGFVEVAGDRAQVVIANPAGISCDGCGFINANRATLTTGTPIMNGGSLEGYVVQRGQATISGNGLDASQADYTDIIARSVEINAGLWAHGLNVIAGANQINADHSQITPIAGSGSAPAFAVDVAQLGGMYAGKIHLVGTEAGVGVRNAGSIGASVGEVALTVDGQLINSGSIAGSAGNTIAAREIVNTGGTLAAGTQLTVNADSLIGDGNLLSTGDLAVTLASDYTHSGQLQADGNATLTTTGNIVNQGDMLAGGTLALTAVDLDNGDVGQITGLDTHISVSDTLTNRGAMDGSNTFIDAGTLENLGAGRIYGDHLALAAGTLTNVAETLNGTTSTPVIAARDRLDIGASNITNSNGALIFSADDIVIGGSLDANHEAIGQAAQLINEGATIEALDNAQIAVTELQNLNANLVTALVVDDTERIREVQPEGWSRRYDISHFPSINNYNIEAQPFVNDAGSVEATFEDYTYYDYTATTRSTHIVISAPGKILASGDMTLVGNVLNSDSQIVVGGTLDISGATLQNLTTSGQQIISYSGTRQFRDWDGDDEELEFGAVVAYKPASKITNFNLATTQLEDNTVADSSGTVVVGLSTPTLSGGLFQPAPDATADYFIETDPRFASYRTWLSSDYMMQQLSFDPAITQKRLGDGFYEQRLIREQIAQLTGRRFLDGYASDEAQYQALMNAGLTLAGGLNLIPGVALTAGQMAQLTSDIVWLVQESVTSPDGTVTQALVPRVYVLLQADDLSPTVGLMAGNSVKINLSGDAINSGTFAGRSLLTLDAANVRNLGGQMAADTVDIQASQDIDVAGGTLAAKNALLLDARQDLTVASTTLDSRNVTSASTFTRTNINRVAGLYVTGDNGVLVASAGRDITLNAADIVNHGVNGTTVIDAGNNLTLGTVTVAEQNNSIHNAKDFNLSGQTQDIGTVIQTSGDISLNARHDLTAKAAKVTSEAGALVANAGNDLNIESGQASHNSDIATRTKRSGTLSSRTKEQRDTFREITAVASTFSADTVTLQAGNDIDIRGSNVVGTQDVTLQAAKDVSIEAAAQTFNQSHMQKTKKSGVFSSGASITVGSQKLATTNDTQQVVNLASTIGSTDGDVNIEAGKAYTQTGSNVLALEGDIDIAAQKVDINAASDTYANQRGTKFKQSGLSVSISNPVISAVQTTSQMAQAESQTSDPRMQALATATTALAVKNAADAVTRNPELAGGININISLGTSKSSSQSAQTVSIARSSQVIAGGDVTIAAVATLPLGDEADLTVIGSAIQAGGDVTLIADNQVNILAAQNITTLNSKNKMSSASVGVSVGTSGFAVTANGSRGDGKANGIDVTYTNATVDGGDAAGDKVEIVSGTNTTLRGAVVSGNQVVAKVGTTGQGSLNIESLQDISTYKSNQSSRGFSASAGPGNYGGSISASNSKIKSDYASVNEQSSIKAGDAGFDIDVAGNTNLAGAVIASTDQAIQNNKNSITTQTLTTSDLANKAEYSANASSVTIGLGTQGGLPQLSGVGMGSDEGKVNTATVSAISHGIVSITDSTTQQESTGTDAVTTVAMLNRDVKVNGKGQAVDGLGNPTSNTIKPIFDASKVQKEINVQVQITQAFSQQAPLALSSYAKEKTQPYQDAKDYEAIRLRQEKNQQLTEYEIYRLAELESSGMTDEKSRMVLDDPQAKADYEHWNNNGDYRKASNIIIAAISGGTSGATAAVTKESLAWAADVMRQNMIEDSMKFPGICTSERDCISNKSGVSVGANGDNVKVAGGRIVLADWCKVGGVNACQLDSTTKSGYAENSDGTVIFKPVDGNGNALSISQFFDQHPELRSPLGGVQGGNGQMNLLGIQFEYAVGSFLDKLAEGYAGTHDTLNSIIWYDELGNGKSLGKSLIGIIGDT